MDDHLRSFAIPLFQRLWKQHARFYIALAIGLAVFAVVMFIDRDIAPLVGGDAFFLSYLLGMIAVVRKAGIGLLRNRARIEDEGIVLIMVATFALIVFLFVSIFSILHDKSGQSIAHLTFALAGVPLGWLVLNTLFAFHYARLFYAPTDEDGDGKEEDSGGLDFPGTPEPGIGEFLYFAFVIGATFQTSDVGVKSTDFRVVVLIHSLASFVFNTVLLALAVNVGASLGS